MVKVLILDFVNPSQLGLLLWDRDFTVSGKAVGEM